MTKCKKCQAPIVWLRSPKAKWIPCDEGLIAYRRNDDEGKDVLIGDDGEYIKCDLTFDGPPDGMARRAHWATCPYGKDFRRR